MDNKESKNILQSTSDLKNIAGEILNDPKSRHNWTYFLVYLIFLALIYIYNTHHAEKLIIQSDKVEDEIKELRAEYLTIKSELEYKSKQSQIADKLADRGIKELRTPPFKITYTKKDEH